MTESSKDLRDTLVRLHDQLQDTQDVNDETRRLLVEVINDIQTVVGVTPQAGILTSSAGHDSLISRLKTAEQSFEVTHPTLAGVIRGLIDTLGQMGI